MKSLKPFLLLLGIFFMYSSCIKDNCHKKFRLYVAIYKTRDVLLSEVKLLPSKKIEKAGKIFSYGNYLFINEIDKGIHIIDNTNPSAPNKIGFLNIQGNLDLWVRNNLLYADCFDNLLVLDINDIHNIKLQESMNKVFPQREFNGITVDDKLGYVVGWEERDTTIEVDCDELNYSYPTRGGVYAFDVKAAGAGSSNFVPPSGVAGSLTRFNITGNYLYCVDNNNIHTFDISQTKPTAVGDLQIGVGIETIFSFDGNLYIGTSSGVLIYSIATPSSPTKVTTMQHVRSCDPVITDGNNAFVTLRGGSPCGGFTNQLDVLDVKNLANVTLVKSYPLTHPYGLGMNDKYLFICDEGYGVRVFDRTDVNQMTEKQMIDIEHPRDIIVFNTTLLILTDTKMAQYDYTDLNNIKWISAIN